MQGVRCVAPARIGPLFEMPTEWSREVVLRLVWGGRDVVTSEWMGLVVLPLPWVGELVVQVVGQMMAAGM